MQEASQSGIGSTCGRFFIDVKQLTIRINTETMMPMKEIC